MPIFFLALLSSLAMATTNSTPAHIDPGKYHDLTAIALQQPKPEPKVEIKIVPIKPKPIVREVIARRTPTRVDVTAVQAQAQIMVAQVWPEAYQWEAFNAVVSRESGWKVGIKNASSGACGLGQALPCSKMGSAYGTAEGEIAWTINYIKARYITPQRALAHEQSYGWY